MLLREAYEKYKKFKIPSFSVIYEKASQYSKTCLLIVVIFLLTSIYLMQQIPHWQVALFGINNSTELAQLENSYRATLAQILGGSAVAVGIYFAWRNIKIAHEGQITERFTRAIDQLGAVDQSGNPAIEIRLGGIYALKRIANESEKDYWPIMEILTAYVRKNSPNGVNIISVSMDIQAILTVIAKPNDIKLNSLDLHGTNLKGANLEGANLTRTNLKKSTLVGANLIGADLMGANLINAKLILTSLNESNLEKAKLNGAWLMGANLEGAKLIEANLTSAYLGDPLNHKVTNLKGADLQGANLIYAKLLDANLTGTILHNTKGLSVDQLSKVKTLYNAKLDDELLIPLKEKYPALFEVPRNEP